MIECDRCKCEIEGELWECLPMQTTDEENFTDFRDNEDLLRYCKKCFNEIMLFLLSEGML